MSEENSDTAVVNRDMTSIVVPRNIHHFVCTFTPLIISYSNK